jgi:hypothetical protein
VASIHALPLSIPREDLLISVYLFSSVSSFKYHCPDKIGETSSCGPTLYNSELYEIALSFKQKTDPVSIRSVYESHSHFSTALTNAIVPIKRCISDKLGNKGKVKNAQHRVINPWKHRTDFILQ